MKASVQYGDFCGTTAADCSDMFIESVKQIGSSIISQYSIKIDENSYDFVGVSVNGTDINKMLVSFFFRNKTTKEVIKIYRYDVSLQDILDLFKRFEFQVGINLDEIDETKIMELHEN